MIKRLRFKHHTLLLPGIVFLTHGVISFPLYATVMPAVGSVSGQILQSNPELNHNVAPRSRKTEKLNEPAAGEKRAEDSGPTLWVKKIQVKNVPDVASDEIEKLVNQYHDKKMTFNGLRNVAVDITGVLQKKGVRLSYAYIPPQKITDGIVTLAIMQGHIESLKLRENHSLLSEGLLQRYLARADKDKGDITALETFMSRISDLPGVGNLTSYLEAGEEPGGSTLNLALTASPRVDGTVVFDNLGSLSSGRDRLGIQLNVNSPLGVGDRLQLLAYVAPDFLQTTNDSKHGNTLIGRLAYDEPVPTTAWRLGAALSRVSYKLGGPVLRGLGDGYADIATLYASNYLLRTDTHNLSLSTNLDFKHIQDKFWGMKNSRKASLFSVQAAGDYQGSLFDKPYILQYQLTPYLGYLSNSEEWNGSHSRGRFFKTVESFSYMQGLYPGISVGLSYSGQHASKNLDGAEKMSLGGAYAVRAYGNSAASVDSGWVISPSLNLPVPGVENASLQLFYDYARGKMQKFAPVSQRVVLKGYGIGLSWNYSRWGFINGSYAWRQGHDKLLGPQNKATGWITTGVRF